MDKMNKNECCTMMQLYLPKQYTKQYVIKLKRKTKETKHVLAAQLHVGYVTV